jgi:hypothetical protein
MFGHDLTRSHPRNKDTISSGIKRGESSVADGSSMELFSELSSKRASSKSYNSCGGCNKKRENMNEGLKTLHPLQLTSISKSGKLNDELKRETKYPMLGICGHD